MKVCSQRPGVTKSLEMTEHTRVPYDLRAEIAIALTFQRNQTLNLFLIILCWEAEVKLQNRDMEEVVSLHYHHPAVSALFSCCLLLPANKT